MLRMLRFLALLLTTFPTVLSQGDPCVIHGTISDPNGERGAMYENSPDDTLKCDSSVTEGWYRMNSPAGNEMPTSCVEPLHCSTAFPVWINGTLPELDSTDIVNMTAVATGDSCGSPPTATWDIHVKSCGTFRVYYLRRTPSCPSAYCFGTTLPCQNGTNSETGGEPGCTLNFPTLTHQPTVDVQVGPLSGSVLRTRQIQFTCAFPNPSNLPANVDSADVLWYYGTEEKEIGPFRVSIGQLPHILNETDWETRGGKVGNEFWCKVRVRGAAYGAPSFWVNSDRYYAGVRINNDNHIVVRGENTVIQLQMTVPILGVGSLMNLVVMVPTVYEPERDCILGEGNIPFAATHCGVRLPLMARDEQWEDYKQRTVDFTVFGKIEYEVGRPQNSHNFIIRFERQGDYATHPVWGNYATSSTVSVTRSSHSVDASALCYSDADPSTRSFDRCTYRPQLEGEFVLYRHKTMIPVQVNVYYQRCYPDNPSNLGTCVCGVAVLSGEEVFIFDQCRVRGRDFDSTPIRIGLLDCSEKSMDIVQTSTTQYRITLPTGAVVTVKRRTGSSGRAWGSRVQIQPSIKDVQQVEGLCGDYDGNAHNDFIHRGSTASTGICGTNGNMNDFLRSWRVNDNRESLYNGRNTGIPGSPLSMYCRCPRVCPVFSCEDTIESRIDCTFDEFIERCRRTGGTDWNERFRKQCEVRKRRRKRSTKFIADDLSDMERESFFYDPDFEAPPPAWRNGWTEERARSECETRILGGPLGSSCAQLTTAGDNFTDAVDSCVDDIKMSGSGDWISVSAGIMRGACESIVSRNTSLWTASGPNNTASPPREFTDLMCPNDCSGHGTCQDGECTCSDGYGAIDCSVDLTAPPNVTGTARDGICDTSTRPCRETPVYGENFVDSSNVTCKVRAVKVWHKAAATSYAARELSGEYIHSEEVMCPLPALTVKRAAADDALLATLYFVSVSNDGEKYSGETRVTAYDSGCISYDGQGNIIITGCYISGQCYTANQASSTSSCMTCQPQRSQVTFSLKANTCNIGSKCYAADAVHPSDPCKKCDPAESGTDWSPKECGTPTIPSQGTPAPPAAADNNGLWWKVLLIILGLLVVITLAVFLGYKFLIRNNKLDTITQNGTVVTPSNLQMNAKTTSLAYQNPQMA